MNNVLEPVLRTLDWLFGCHHRNLSWAFTRDGRTYRVCWDCGCEFDYCWSTLRFASHRRHPHALWDLARHAIGLG